MQRLIAVLAISLAAAVVDASPVQSQAVSALRTGVRIEVTPVTGKTTTGWFSSVMDDSLSFVIDDAAASREKVSLADLRLVRMSQGRSHARGAGRGALLGLLAGALGGGLIGAFSDTHASNCFPFCSRSGQVIVGTMGGGALGLVGGLVFGAAQGIE